MAPHPPSTLPDATSNLGGLTVVSSFVSCLKANGLDSLEAMFSIDTAERLAKPGLDSWRERLRLQLGHEGRTITCYLKRFANPPAAFSREVRRSGSGARSVAGMEWTWMRRLAAEGIPAVQPVAFGEHVIGRRERRSAILALAVPGRSLEAWWGVWTGRERSKVEALIDATAALAARFHGLGYVHRDLYAAHLFFDPDAEAGKALHLIDVQRIFRPRRRMRRWIVKDLAALNYSCPARLVTRSDRLRWLKRYLGLTKLDAPAVRLAYRIIGKTYSIAAHDRRRTARAATGTVMADQR